MSENSEPRRENVYKQLREEILSCTIAPGQSLHENDLAGRFRVSKSPIRDALMRLEAERLVIVLPRKGYRVAPVSISDAAELFDFRRLMEETVVEIGTASASEADLAALDRFRTLDAWGGAGGFVNYNREFHLTLARLCPNRRIRETAQELIEEFDRLVVISIAAMDRPERDGVIEHTAIIDRIQAREGRKAARLIRRHIDRARRRVMGSLAQSAIVA